MRPVTFSRSFTVVPTYTCRNCCRYCGFRTPAPHLTPPGKVQEMLLRAKAQGCREILIMTGERPWEVPGFPLAEDGFIEHIHQICLAALRLGLLPHTNIGVIASRHLRRLKEVNASMGLMLESVNDNLPAHQGPLRKRAPDRLAFIAAAGEMRIPFTTGILVGIGESPPDRYESLETIRDLHRRYGHIQEIIIQNFKPQPGTPMAGWPEPSPQEMIQAVRWARELMPEMPIQIPPNLNANYIDLLRAGANDLGGISPDIDHINPQHPWPSIGEIGRTLRPAGFYLQERLPVYLQVDADLAPAADRMRRELAGDAVSYIANGRLCPSRSAVMHLGHGETWEARVRYLETTRRTQLKTGAFAELVLWPSPAAPLEETLKFVAYARLFFGRDLVDIRVSWAAVGVEGTVRALACGGNAFGPIQEGGLALAPPQVEAAIRQAGRVPVQRDAPHNSLVALPASGS